MARIAIISTMAGYPWGGSEYLWAAMAKAALAEQHQVLISVYDWSVTHPIIIELQQQGAKVFPRCRDSRITLFSRILKKINKTFPILNFLEADSPFFPIFQSNPDIIYINHGSIYDTIYSPELLGLLNLYSIPYIIICQLNHDSWVLDSTERKLAQQLFNQAVKIIFVSQHNLKLAERQLAQSLPNAIIVQNPVNLSDFHPVPFPNDSMIYFANVARLDVAFKGQDILWETLSLPQWKERNWQCRLYGSGPDQPYLERLAQHYGIANRVQFMGYVPDVRAIWRENHLLVLPSRAEGTPLALIEAMLCDRPAVVTDVGGNAEWVEEGQTGFIASAPTVKSFSAALEKAWQAQKHWARMGSQAYQVAMVQLDRNPGKSLLKLIDEIL